MPMALGAEPISSRRPKIVLVGAGWVVRTCYVPALAEIGAQVEAVVDLDREAAQRVATELGAREVGPNLSDVVARPADLVVVATPNHTHVPLTEMALLAGHRVLCEKPLTTCEADAERLVSFGGNRLLISSPYRNRPEVSELLRLREGGELGRVLRVSASWTRVRGIPRPGSWYTDGRRSGGGVLADLGSHLVDLGLQLLGWPDLTDLHAWTGRLVDKPTEQASRWMPIQPGDRQQGGALEVEDQASVLASFSGGESLELHVTWATREAHDRTRITIEGTEGTAFVETLLGYSDHCSPHPPRLCFRTDAEEREIEFPPERSPARDFGMMLRSVFGGGGRGPATGAEALRVTQILARSYHTAIRSASPVVSDDRAVRGTRSA